MRSGFSYSSTSAPAMPGSTITIGASDSAFSMPRYVDSNPRLTKSPRHQGHQSVHSGDGSDYRYGSFRSMSGASVGDVSPGSNPPPGRDYYPTSSGAWTSSAPEHNSSLAYAGNDGRSFGFGQDPYKSGAPGAPAKHDNTPYSGSARGSFDSMNNYSWTAA